MTAAGFAHFVMPGRAANPASMGFVDGQSFTPWIPDRATRVRNDEVKDDMNRILKEAA